MNDQGQDLSLQDNIAELASQLSHSNFNVKQFKRMHAAKHIKLSNQRTLSRIYTEHSQTKFEGSNASLHSKTVGQGLNKALRYVDTHIPPKKQLKFFSKPLVKSADKLQQVRSKKKLASTQKDSSNLQKYERQWSSGKMKERCIEEWLNAILIEYCHDEYFDKSIANSALKKFAIDENSLVAKGLPPENITRLYRGLFVFGMGFNSLIGELTHGNMEVLKTIWRIYSIILEYCSKGGMVTVIGEIERETSAKIAVLTNEIVRKQQIIEKNEELNQEKNGEIFREIKKLREDNVNLNNEKTVLVEEYNSTEQAFSEEVSLRLKFQTKINEIYGLHRDLGIKHQKLFQDFSKKVQELRVCADKYFQSTIKTQQFKQTQYRLREQLILLKLSSKKQNQYLEELVKERIELLNKISKLQYIVIQSQNQLQELKNKEKRWLNDKINMEATIQFREKSSKETHTEYQITLEENNRLYILLSDQRKVMEDYEKEKKNFNSKVIAIVSENSYHKRKMEQIQRRYDALQEINKQLNEKMEQLHLQLDIKIKNEESYQSFFTNSELNLVEMRKINIANEEQLTFLRKFHRNMDKILKEKNETAEALTAKYHKTLQEIQRLILQNQELKSKYSILQEQKRISEQVFHMKEAKLKLIEQQLNLKSDQLEKIKVNYAIEEDRLRAQLDKMIISYKNQKFERTTLNTSYIQTLKTVQKKNATERELNVKISFMEGHLEKEKTKYRVMEKNLMDVITKLNTTQEQLEDTLLQQRALIVKKQQYQHPMINEDLQAALNRQIQRNEDNTALIKALTIDVEKTKKFAQQEVERLHQSYRWDINVLSKQAENKIELVTNQLTFQKKENSELKEKVKEFEMIAQSYRKKINQRETSEREEIYRRAIEEKKKQVDDMFKEIEKLQDELHHSKRINAQLAMQSPDTHRPDHDDDSNRGKIEAIRKELEHEYNLKFRELQREMKQQISRKQEELKEEQQAIIKGMSIEEILKLKEMKAGQLIKQLSVTQKTDKFRELSANHSVEINRESFYKREASRNHEDLKNRRQINRLIKQAYEYYN